MAKPVTDDERQRIIEAIQQGRTCRDVASDFGRSPTTISSIAQSIGWRFGQSNASRAHESRSAYSAERRAQLAARFTEVAERLLDDLDGEYLVFNFGGKENTYAEHTLDAPPVEAKRQIVQAAREAIRTVLDIDRHDNRAGDAVDDVSRWLLSLGVGDRAEAA